MNSGAAFAQARGALRPYARQAAMISAGSTILYMLLWMVGVLAERGISRLEPVFALPFPLRWADLLLPLLLMGSLSVLTAYRNRVDEQIGRMTGLLTECDLGFLACSGRFWLWRRRMAVGLLGGTLLILSFAPSILLLSATLMTLRLAAAVGDATLHLFLLLQLLTGAILLLVLPLRVCCTMAAVPLCFLKQPHRSAWRVWGYAMGCTKGICGRLLHNRIRCAVCIILPVYWFSGYPQLLASEMLLCSQKCKNILPEI